MILWLSVYDVEINHLVARPVRLVEVLTVVKHIYNTKIFKSESLILYIYKSIKNIKKYSWTESEVLE